MNKAIKLLAVILVLALLLTSCSLVSKTKVLVNNKPKATEKANDIEDETSETEAPDAEATEAPFETDENIEETVEPSDDATEAPSADATEEPSSKTTASAKANATSSAKATATATAKATATTKPNATTAPSGTNVMKITSGGVYTYSGTITGTIIVDAPETDKVEIVLNGAKISCSNGAPIYSKSCDSLKITVNAGTTNEINDNRSAVSETEDEVTSAANAKGAIYAEQDLKIKGSGTLTVKGTYNNGIHTKDDLEIQEVTLKVTATHHALKGNDEVSIKSGTINLTTTSGNGIKTENTEISDKGNQKGNILIGGGKITIKSGNDGINAAYECKITDGDIAIAANDDAIHADKYLTIHDGTINVTTSYEALEAPTIVINGGDITVYARDDGINAADGSATESFGGRPGGMSSSSSNCTLTINGGNIDVTTASGDTDAIDCNGSYIQTGGFVLVKGGSSAGNVSGSIDVDGSVNITGGTTVALGGICETPVNSCNAYCMGGVSFSSGTYTLKCGSTEIFSFTLKQTYSSGWICSNKLETGKTYTLYRGSTQVASWTQTAGTMGSTSGGQTGPGGDKPGRRY